MKTQHFTNGKVPDGIISKPYFYRPQKSGNSQTIYPTRSYFAGKNKWAKCIVTEKIFKE